MKKECNLCGESKPLTDFYSQKKKRKDGTEYLYYRPDCKDCTSKRALKWNQNNPKAVKRANRKYYGTERGREANREDSKRRRDNGNWYKWLKESDRKYDRSHKTHEISEREWESCKSYFNNCCAYCGLHEDEHKKLYNQQLHKEHVDHEGSNRLDNCVPSCKPCNGSKYTFDFEFWYKERSGDFSLERLAKIRQWLEFDHKNYIDELQ